MTVCVACDNGYHFELEPYQRALPAQEADLRARVEAYERLAREAKAQADATAAEIARLAKLGPTAGLCAGHREHLHRVDLAQRWMGGSLHIPLSSPRARAPIREVLAYLATRQPGRCPRCLHRVHTRFPCPRRNPRLKGTTP